MAEHLSRSRAQAVEVQHSAREAIVLIGSALAFTMIIYCGSFALGNIMAK
jgi:hypothetical protein